MTSPRCNLTNEQLEQRLKVLEGMMQRCNWKELPGINATYQRVLNELVQRDLSQPMKGRKEVTDGDHVLR